MGARPTQRIERGLDRPMVFGGGADLSRPVEARRQGAGAAQSAFHDLKIEGEAGAACVETLDEHGHRTLVADMRTNLCGHQLPRYMVSNTASVTFGSAPQHLVRCSHIDLATGRHQHVSSVLPEGDRLPRNSVQARELRLRHE